MSTTTTTAAAAASPPPVEPPAKLSPAQFNYTLFRNLGNAIAKVVKNDAKLILAGAQAPGHFNLYVLTHTKTTVHYAPQIKINPQSHFIQELVPQAGKPFPFETRRTPSTYLIGYDTEFQVYEGSTHPDYPAKLLSHQFYCNFNGHRFGVVFLTTTAFRAIDFIRLINRIVPDNEELTCVGKGPNGRNIYVPELQTVRIYAHFSLIESGWMAPTMRLKSETEDFFGYFRREYASLIQERDKEWVGGVTLRQVSIDHPEAKRNKNGTKKQFEWNVHLLFADSGNLIGKGISLKDLGQRIGIDKVSNANISEMEKYLATNPDDFCYYGIIDSLISAESHLWHNNEAQHKLGLQDEQVRTAALSADVFKDIFMQIYLGEEWKEKLGYENGSSMTIAHKAYVKYYFGGRNEVMQVGPVGRAIYYDLRSAYPTALIMLPDYDCSKSYTYQGKDALLAVERMEQSSEGPFQIAGITVSFKFRDNVQPMFPVRIDEPTDMPKAHLAYNTDGLIFPRSGHTNVTWPELWVARRKQYNGEDLFDELVIHSLTTFENLGTYKLSKAVLEILSKRDKKDKAMDGFYKQILNFFYGKTAEGVRDEAKTFKAHDIHSYVRHSPVTCYPIASFITGFCRAAVGELLQYFECIGITTDGFISQDTTVEHEVAMSTTERLYFCRTVHNRVMHLNPFISIDSQGDNCLFLKTRGYLFTSGGKIQSKLARAGAQAKRVAKVAASTNQDDIDKYEQEHITATEDFLQKIQSGRCNKVTISSLKSIRKFFKMEVDARMEPDPIASTAKKLIVNIVKGNATKQRDEDEDDLYKGKVLSGRILPRTVESLPLMVTRENMKVNATFDMKRIPVDPDVQLFMWNGKRYEFVSFKTRPLETASDFHLLRTLANRTSSHREYIYKHFSCRTSTSTYSKLNSIQMLQPITLTGHEVSEVSDYLPELAEHWQKKEEKRQCAYEAALQKMFDVVASYASCEGFTARLEAKYSEKSLESYLSAVSKIDIFNAPPQPGFINPSLTEEQKNKEEFLEENNIDPLQAGFEGDYYPELGLEMKIKGEIDKVLKQFIKEADIQYDKPAKRATKYLEFTTDIEKRLSFLARFGGGKNEQPGMIEQEPIWMEIEDYEEMLDQFEDVTEITVQLSELQMEIIENLSEQLIKLEDNSDDGVKVHKKKRSDLTQALIIEMKRRERKRFKEEKQRIRAQAENAAEAADVEEDISFEKTAEKKAQEILRFQELAIQHGLAEAYKLIKQQREYKDQSQLSKRRI